MGGVGVRGFFLVGFQPTLQAETTIKKQSQM